MRGGDLTCGGRTCVGQRVRRMVAGDCDVISAVEMVGQGNDFGDGVDWAMGIAGMSDGTLGKCWNLSICQTKLLFNSSFQ